MSIKALYIVTKCRVLNAIYEEKGREKKVKCIHTNIQQNITSCIIIKYKQTYSMGSKIYTMYDDE